MNRNITSLLWKIYFWLLLSAYAHYFVTKRYEATLEDIILSILSFITEIPPLIGLACFVFNKNFLHKIFWKLFTPLFILLYLSAMIIIYFSYKISPPLGMYLLICLGVSSSVFPLFYALINYSYLRK